MKFVIEKDGSVGETIIMNEGKTHPLLEKEAVRVIKSLPKWNPANNNGTIVRCYQRIPINFKLKN